MHIFIDESFIKSSNEINIAFILVKNDCTEKLNQKLIFLLKELGIDYLHYNKLGKKQKEQFLKRVIQLKEWSFLSAKVNAKSHFKALMDGSSVLFDLVPYNQFRTITLDGKLSNNQHKKYQVALRNKGISCRKLRGADDKKSPILQLADFVANLIRKNNKSELQLLAQNLHIKKTPIKGVKSMSVNTPKACALEKPSKTSLRAL